jgi:hypothetical protein
MRLGTPKAAALLVLLAVAATTLAACGGGSSDETTTTTAARPAVSQETADHLAKLSDRIASDLDAGDLCHAAHTADDLNAAVQDSDLPAELRPGVETVATDLVNQVNCPPPPAPPPAPEPKPKPDEHQDQKDDHQGPANGDENGNGQGSGHDGKPKPPGHGGHGPPGHAKLEGGD